MKFGITPCPNDTFSYFALISGALEGDFEFVFDDIEGLNLSARSQKYEITKMSFAAYLENSDKYALLDAGAALGVGTGPVLVGTRDFDAVSPVAVPGLNTTAALLLRFYAGGGVQRRMKPMYFRDILGAVSRGETDFGVLIHEGRFVFEKSGLRLLEDLGAYWTQKTALPVPLGCICLRRDMLAKKEEVEAQIRASVRWAFASPEKVLPYVKSRAQYLEDGVLQKHIYAFVNEYSLDISHIREKLLNNLQLCRRS